MKTENVITIICAVLGSGIISMLLQRYWSKVDEKKAEERAQSEEAKQEKAQRDLNTYMIKKLFRTNLNRTITYIRKLLDDPEITESHLRLELADLRDDMKDYFEMGGNGATHAAYVELYEEIKLKKPELISIAWLDFIAKDVR